MPAEPSFDRQQDGRLIVGTPIVWAMAIAACKQRKIWGRRQKDTLWKQVASSAWSQKCTCTRGVKRFILEERFNWRCNMSCHESDGATLLKQHEASQCVTSLFHTCTATMKLSGHQDELYMYVCMYVYKCPNQVVWSQNSQKASGSVDDVDDNAQSLAASYSFCLASILISTLLLVLQIHLNTCSVDINAKTVIIKNESSSSFKHYT